MNSWNRRRFLTAVGSAGSLGMAGCLGTGESTPASVETEIVDIVEATDVPIEFTIDQSDTVLSDDALPRFSLTVHNDGDETLGFWHNRPPVFNPGPSAPVGFRILSDAEGDRIERGDSEVAPADPDGCLYSEYGPERDSGEWWLSLSPDESDTRDFAYVAGREGLENECPATGEYVFRREFEFFDENQQQKVPEEDEPEYVIDWGFAVRVLDE